MTDTTFDLPLQESPQIATVAVSTSQHWAEMLRTFRSWLRPSLILTVATAFAQFALFALQGVLLARMLGPTGRGEFGTAVFYAQSMTYLGLIGTLFAVARRAAIDPAGRTELSRTTAKLAAVTGIGTIAIAALLAYISLPIDKRVLFPLCVLACLALPFEHWRLLLLAVDQGSGAFRRQNLNQMITTAILPLLLILFWIADSHSVYVAVLLTLTAPIIGLTFRLTAQRDRTLAKEGQSLRVVTLVREGAPYLLSVAAMDLFSRADVFLFLALASFTSQGYYAIAVPAAGLLLVAPDALALFSFNAGANGVASTKHLLVAGCGLALFQTVTAIAFAMVVGSLIRLMYGAQFANALPLTWALLPGFAANGFSRVAEGYLRGRGKVKAGIGARLFAVPLMISVALLLLSSLKDLAIPIAASIAHIMVAAILVSAIALDNSNRKHAGNSLAVGEQA
jgi:antigen flippase